MLIHHPQITQTIISLIIILIANHHQHLHHMSIIIKAVRSTIQIPQIVPTITQVPPMQLIVLTIIKVN
jgi:hypothetical protein